MFQEALIDTSGGSPAVPAEPASPPARVPLRELEDGQQVKGVYAVRQRELRRKRNGEPWLRLVLGDASGSAEAVAWEDAEALYALAAPGTPVEVGGVFEMSERWGAKIKLSGLREAAPNEYDSAELKEWVPKIQGIAEQARETHVLMNNCYRDYAVNNARQLAGLLGLDE